MAKAKYVTQDELRKFLRSNESIHVSDRFIHQHSRLIVVPKFLTNVIEHNQGRNEKRFKDLSY